MKVVKVLSLNDTGATGSHQSGILVPKVSGILDFFPRLNSDDLNPRACLEFEDDSGKKWEFNFIYYNNKFFGGTRNEYRITRILKYINQQKLSAGDEVIFENKDDRYLVSNSRMNKNIKKKNYLVLGAGWRVVNI